MSAPSIVREAKATDEPEIWRLFKLAHEENGLYSLDEEKVGKFLYPVLFARKGGVIGVIGDKALEAIIMLVYGKPWYSNDVSMDDCLSFVDPAHRHSGHAKALIAFAKRMVDGIRKFHSDFKMTLGVVSTERTAAKIRLYSQQLTPVGMYFCYPAPDGMSRESRLARTKYDQQKFMRDYKRL